MKVFFCDVCGVRVTDVDLSGGRGMRRRNDVICSTCLELGHGRQWAEERGLSQRTAAEAASADAQPPAANPVIDAARDRAATMPDHGVGSLAAAASGFSALAPDAPASPPAAVDDIEDAAHSADSQDSAMPQAPALDTSAPADKQGAGSAKRSAARSGKAQTAKGVSTKSAKVPQTARSARKAAQEKQKIILVTLVGLCVIMLVGLGIMLTQNGKSKAVDGRVIELSAERDKLFDAVRSVREVAFREPHGLPDAEIEATIAKIHDLQSKVESFEDFAKRGGWSEENVAAQLETWNVSDIYGKLKMWNDENAKRKMRAMNGQ